MEIFDFPYLTKVIYTIVTVFAAFILSKIFRRILRKSLVSLPEDAAEKFSFLPSYLIYFLTLFVLLKIWGFDLGNILLSLGAFSIAISFAMKNTIENLVSGILIMMDKPFKVGDEIEVKGVKGKVEKITIRYTVISAGEAKVFIPSKTIANELVKNYS